LYYQSDVITTTPTAVLRNVNSPDVTKWTAHTHT
jgi:hypothetical protein